MNRPVAFGALCAVLGILDDARGGANPELTCQPDDPRLEDTTLLRALSLDLRGTVPTVKEYESLDVIGIEGLVDEWLEQEAFTAQVVRRHRQYFWNNLSGLGITDMRIGVGNGIHYRAHSKVRKAYRGDATAICTDEPATFDEDGNLQFTIDDAGVRREGWVEVSPYWAPETTVKVCAFDAQTNTTTRDGRPCHLNSLNPECGCGEHLQSCTVGSFAAKLMDTLGRDIDERVADLFRANRPYTELFTGGRAFVNGTLVHYYRHLARYDGAQGLNPPPVDIDALPDLAVSNDELVPIELGPQHAGVLTSPAYLLRFQTNRARASRFYEIFMCQPFSPPAGGLPAASDACSAEPDLQKRCGCKYCHSLLEPAAAHWGRWPESGAGYLDPQAFPLLREDCRACAQTGIACDPLCKTQYVMKALSPAEKEFLGYLRAYSFLRPEHHAHLEQGPKLLVHSAVADNRFPRCVATRTIEWLLGRAPREDEATWLNELSEKFLRSGFNYRGLVRAIVTSDTYRRVR